MEQVTENVEEILILKDLRTGKVLYENSAFKKIYGFTVNETKENTNH